MTFHTTKGKLSRTKTLPLANSDFVNSPFTVENPYNRLSVNALQKTSKKPFFSTKNISVRKEGLNLGVKFEYFMTNLSEIAVTLKQVFVQVSLHDFLPIEYIYPFRNTVQVATLCYALSLDIIDGIL